jgi:hypothetical protein
MHHTHTRRQIEPIDEWTAFSRIEQDIAIAGIDLIGAIWPNPVEAVPIVAQEGIADSIFTDDLRVLFLVCDIARQYADADRRRLARRALFANRFWDDAAPAFECGRLLWSDASLAALAEGHFHSPQLIRLNARNLIRLRVAQRDAAEHLREARRLLCEVAA